MPKTTGMNLRGIAVACPLAALLAACPPPPAEDAGPDEPGACTEPSEVACRGELTTELQLSDGAPSPQVITNLNATGGTAISVVDARAGGTTADPRQPYLYARFTESGLAKVPLDDEEALESTAWDIAFHRYVIRLNGGSSGPGCIAAARLEGAEFDAVTEVPDDATFVTDDQFADGCAFRAETEALDPGREVDFGTALRGYYDYVGCLKMTYDPFLVRLGDGGVVKLMVTAFYDNDAQQQCQETDTTSSVGAATFQIRWTFLDGDVEVDEGPGDLGDAGPAFLSTDNGDGTFSSAVDATSDEWIYFDLQSNAIVEPASPDDSTDWDLGFNRFHVKMNGGVSGTGGMEAAVHDGTFADLTEVPADGFRTDEADADNDGWDEHVISSGDAAWFVYNTETHVLEVTGSVFALKSVEGEHYRLELTDYYRDVGGNQVSGFPSFRWGLIGAEGPSDAGPTEAGPLDAGADGGISAADAGVIDAGPDAG